MANQKVLFVCFDFSHLVSCELALLKMGYDVTTVLGSDGVMAHSGYADCCLVILGDSAADDREFVEQWLGQNHPSIPVIVFGDLRP